MMATSLMIILIGLSGAGKSTLRDYVLYKKVKAKKLLAVTDRAPRTSERDGLDKFFVDPIAFQQLEIAGELCLVNKIYGHMYAFRKKDFLCGGIYIGELHYKSMNEFLRFHPNTISIYIKPQKIENVLQGLRSRGSLQEEILVRENSLLLEDKELSCLCHQDWFDYVFINDFTERSKQEFCKLIKTIICEED